MLKYWEKGLLLSINIYVFLLTCDTGGAKPSITYTSPPYSWSASVAKMLSGTYICMQHLRSRLHSSAQSRSTLSYSHSNLSNILQLPTWVSIYPFLLFQLCELIGWPNDCSADYEFKPVVISEKHKDARYGSHAALAFRRSSSLWTHRTEQQFACEIGRSAAAEWASCSRTRRPSGSCAHVLEISKVILYRMISFS